MRNLVLGFASAVSLALAVPLSPQGGAKALITAADLTYLGYYDVQTGGLNTTYAKGFALRKINGETRFLSNQFVGHNPTRTRLDEFSIAGKKLGDTITETTAQWPDIGGISDHYAVGWDESTRQIWTTPSRDYVNTFLAASVHRRALAADGTLGPKVVVSIDGIPDKRMYGGCVTPSGALAAFLPAGHKICGWGGYTSLVAQGGGASMGFTAYAIPDPMTATGAVKPIVLADHVSGTSACSPDGSHDRGIRLTAPLNYYDGGDARQNPRTAPVDPPRDRGCWLSPARDGKNRFVWGDGYMSAVAWVDRPASHGLVAVATVCEGKCWYGNSNLKTGRKVRELHVFDPAVLAEARAGRRKPWNVQPSQMSVLDLPGYNPLNQDSGAAWPPAAAEGLQYDAATGILYLYSPGGGKDIHHARIWAFQVR
jgi:hypothetical protein